MVEFFDLSSAQQIKASGNGGEDAGEGVCGEVIKDHDGPLPLMIDDSGVNAFGGKRKLDADVLGTGRTVRAAALVLYAAPARARIVATNFRHGVEKLSHEQRLNGESFIYSFFSVAAKSLVFS